jgi:hypothetical protein
MISLTYYFCVPLQVTDIEKREAEFKTDKTGTDYLQVRDDAAVRVILEAKIQSIPLQGERYVMHVFPVVDPVIIEEKMMARNALVTHLQRVLTEHIERLNKARNHLAAGKISSIDLPEEPEIHE